MRKSSSPPDPRRRQEQPGGASRDDLFPRVYDDDAHLRAVGRDLAVRDMVTVALLVQSHAEKSQAS
jgi:hypothetical protein